MLLTEVLHIFLNLAIQYILLVGIFYYITSLNITFKEVSFSTLFVFAPAMFLYLISPMVAILYLFLSQFVFLYIRHPNFKTLTFLSISIIIGLCADHFASILLLKLISSHAILFFYLRLIIYIIISLCLAAFIKRLITYLNHYLEPKITFFFTITLIFMISIFYMNIYPYLKNQSIGLLLINGFLIILLTGVFFILSTMLIRIKINRYQLNMEKQEQENFKSYVAAVERINNDMQKFRHDYLNILLSVRGYIQERDIDGLATFFDEGILKFENKTLLSSKVVKTLERVQNPPLKGLLFNKFIYAHEQNIPITLEIAEPIQLPKIKHHIELIRIIGILLDNAIDNSLIHRNYRIEIAIVNLNNSVLLVFRNQINLNEFDIKKIFQEGYSTKGKERGIGLSNVKNIINHTEDMSMHYWVEDGWYNFELFVKGGH